MDLYQGFVNAIGKHMPKAVRVADRYHVARLAQRAFDKVHVEARKRLPTGERLAMFRKRGLLATRDFRLTEGERAQAAETLASFPLLQAAHQAKESFLAIYDCKDRRQADQALTRWLATLPAEISVYFRELTSAVSNHREIILNYFSHRYTNAFTEASNGVSKLLQHTGRGYGFEIIRVKLLYGKRGQAIDLGDYDNDDNLPAGHFGYAMGRFAASGKKAGSTSGKPHRRGPAFSRVVRLIDEGYYDLGNDAIAKELTPLIEQFSRVS